MNTRSPGLYTAFSSWTGTIVLGLVALFCAAQGWMIRGHANFGYDDSIYIGMARHFSSFSKMGFFEIIRPLVLPLVLGAGEFIGLDVLVFSRTFAILAAAATIGLTYKITAQVSDKISGVFAALIVAGSQTFFQYSHMVLTDVPSVCLSLLSFLFFQRDAYYRAGFFASLAFMTRFPHGILLLSYALVFLCAALKHGQTRATIRNAGRFLAAYSIPLAGFMLFNLLRYPGAGIRAPLLPLIRAQTVVIDNGRWLNQGDWTYYFAGLMEDHLFYVAALAGCWVLARTGKFNFSRFGFPLLTIILFIVYFSRLDLKYIRYIIAFTPYLALFAGIGMHHLARLVGWSLAPVALAAGLFAFGITNVNFNAITQPDGKSAAGVILASGYQGRVLTSTPYVIPHLEHKIHAVVMPEYFLMELTKRRDRIVVHSPQSFWLPDGDPEAAAVVARIESVLESDYEQIGETGDPVYSFLIYRPKPVIPDP